MTHRNHLIPVALLLIAGAAASQSIVREHHPEEGERLWSAAAGLGDVNGDGTPDYALSAWPDRVRVHDGATGALLYAIEETRHGAFGWSLDGAGDVNNDGHGDLIVGATVSNISADSAGAAFVYSGVDGALLYLVPGPPVRGAHSGWDVTTAGDLTGDGHADFIVGAPGAEATQVFSGSDGTQLGTLQAGTEGSGFGSSIDGGHDLDGDGTPDFLIGAPNDRTSDGVSFGSIRAYSGADGSLLFTVFGSHIDDDDYNRFGHAVALLPDVDGDGRTDFVVGAPYAHRDAGRVDVYSGATQTLLYTFRGSQRAYFGWSVTSAGDMDSDGLTDFLVGSPQAGTSGCVHLFSGVDGMVLIELSAELALSNPSGAFFGGVVSSVGDVNGDSRSEFLVCASQHENPVTERDGVVLLLDLFNDCNANGVHDTRDVVDGGSPDCNANEVPDECEIAGGRSPDCNANGVPDECDIAGGTSSDQDADGVPDECEFEVFCDAAVNSTGAPAAISWSGTNSVSANDLVLSAASLPTFASGLFVYSPDRDSVPLGNGVLCLGSATQGFINRLPPEQSDAGGVLTRALDLTTPPVPASTITPGSTWNFSCWFRDVPAGGAGFNFSDGLQVTFQP